MAVASWTGALQCAHPGVRRVLSFTSTEIDRRPSGRMKTQMRGVAARNAYRRERAVTAIRANVSAAAQVGASDGSPTTLSAAVSGTQPNNRSPATRSRANARNPARMRSDRS